MVTIFLNKSLSRKENSYETISKANRNHKHSNTYSSIFSSISECRYTFGYRQYIVTSDKGGTIKDTLRKTITVTSALAAINN